MSHAVPMTLKPVSSPKLCLHCGVKVPRGEASDFCCQGCAAVHTLLQERGLEDYYTLRETAGSRAPAAPVKLAAEGYAYLDEPEFLRDYAFGDFARTMDFYLEGAHCAACVWLTEKLPEFAPGVRFLRLNLASGIARVTLYEGGTFAQAAEELARLGYRPHPVRQGDSKELRKKENHKHLVQLAVAGMLAGNIMLLAVALYAGAEGSIAGMFRWTSLALYLPVLLYSAMPFYRSAWVSLRTRAVSIDVPIVFGILVGTAASISNLIVGSPHVYFDSLSALVFLLLATRYLLSKVNQHALSATELIHHLAPSKARRKLASGLGYEEIKTEALKLGDVIRVLPGEGFPIDGVVLAGKSTVNCALLTGEPTPCTVAPGARVNAGTWNQHAPLEVRVAASGAGTRLGKIVAAMEQGLANKAPIVVYLDRVGQGFVVAVLALTCIGFLLGLSVSWHEAINRALAIAIVVCPCTFALATPLAMSLAIARCARGGILVKGPDVIERLSQVREVYFDKTGTLTYGELSVMNWREDLPGATEALLALEARSAHPVARAVQYHFRGAHELMNLPPVEDFRERAGYGVSGRILGHYYEVRGHAAGGYGMRSRHGVWSYAGVFRDGELAGALTLSDLVRPDSRQALDRLRAMGLGVHLLSGDERVPVLAVASEVGLSASAAEASAAPERKASVVKGTPFSLMVGDGANDAIALAAAHAGVAVHGGMEMSMRAAGAYSSKPGVAPVVSLLVVSRETMRVIRRNLAFALLYNIVGIGVALTGRLDPLFAAVLMPLSALTVFVSTISGTKLLRSAFGETAGKEDL